MNILKFCIINSINDLNCNNIMLYCLLILLIIIVSVWLYYIEMFISYYNKSYLALYEVNKIWIYLNK